MLLHFVSGRNGKSQNRSKHRVSRTTHSRKEKAYKDDRKNFGTAPIQYSRKCRRLLWHGWIAVLRKMSYAKGSVLRKRRRSDGQKQEALISQQKHSDLVRRLKAEGFSDPAMLNWTFENDNGRSLQLHHAQRYVEQWQTMRSESLGLLLWGGVGTGKSFPLPAALRTL